MPHCILELTPNLSPGLDKTGLMQDLARAINCEGLFIPDDIKIRLYTVNDTFMGTEVQEHAFACAEVILLDNKTEAQCAALLEQVQQVLVAYFGNNPYKHSITSRITLVNPKYYRRTVNY